MPIGASGMEVMGLTSQFLIGFEAWNCMYTRAMPIAQEVIGSRVKPTAGILLIGHGAKLLSKYVY